MKVRQQRIDDFESVAGRDEQAGSRHRTAAERPQAAADSRLRTTVVPTATTRPPRARVSATASQTLALDSYTLAMHPVLVEIIDAHGLKRACAHMQRHIRGAHAHAGAALQHGDHRNAIPPSVRRRRRPLARTRSDSGGVVRFGVAFDIRRQRHRAMALEVRRADRRQLELEQIFLPGTKRASAPPGSTNGDFGPQRPCWRGRAQGCAVRPGCARAGFRLGRRSASRR